MVTCDELEKVSSSQNVLPLFFQKKKKLSYGELNRLLVGSGQIPLNIELQQDDRTVCCSHTVVHSGGQIGGASRGGPDINWTTPSSLDGDT